MPHNDNYCITTGWLNAPLRGLRFFAGLEWLITRLTGVEANHHRVRRYSGDGSQDPRV